MTHPSFTRPPVPYKLPGQHTNPHSCAAAVDAVAAVLDNAVKPVLLAGAACGRGGAGWLPDSWAAAAVAQARVLDRRGGLQLAPASRACTGSSAMLLCIAAVNHMRRCPFRCGHL